MEKEQYELYLIRHGVAAERGESYPDDTKRPLTTKGIQRLRQAGKALVALDVTFDVILTSPLVRTGLGELAARLLGLRKPLEFKKGGIARFDVTSVPLTAPAQLRWFLTPRILRRVGK